VFAISSEKQLQYSGIQVLNFGKIPRIQSHVTPTEVKAFWSFLTRVIQSPTLKNNENRVCTGQHSSHFK
jgi:predicted nucleotide-binding protein (sugar kinase/HSP70/actin superfamily)